MTERFTKIKESAIRKVPYGSIIKVEKFISCEDTKRKWLEKFNLKEMQDSTPLKIIEGITELEFEDRRFKAEQKFKQTQERMLEVGSELYEERFGDFFDSMGDDITKEEFYDRETNYTDFE